MKKVFLLSLALCIWSSPAAAAQVRGWPDTSFNTANLSINASGQAQPNSIPAQGAVFIKLSEEGGQANAVLVNSTGSYILVGTSELIPGFDLGAIAVVTEDGNLDRTFNPLAGGINSAGQFFTNSTGTIYSGALLFDFSATGFNDTQANAAVVDKDDNIYVAGIAPIIGPGNFENAYLAAFTPTGGLLQSFNPSGINYDASGNPTGGGFPGLVALSLGASISDLRGLARDDNGTFYLGGRGAVGPDLTGTRGSNFLIFSVTPTGVLNTQFNQNNVAINTAGMEVTGVYPGLLAIAVGIDNLTQRDLALDDASNLVLLGYGNALSSGTLEVILAKVSTSGVLDRSFNPSGLAISSTGAEISGGYSGIKIVQPSPSGISLAKTVAVGPDNRLLVGALGVRGGEKEAETAFVYVVLNEDGSADQAFNPSGLSIDVAGQLVNDGLGYPGVLYDETGFVVTPRAMLYDSNHDVYVLAGFGVGLSSTAIAGGGFISSVSTTGANDTTFNPDSFAALRPFLVSGREGLTILSTTIPVALLSDIILDSKGRYVLGGAALVDAESSPDFVIVRLNPTTVTAPPSSPNVQMQTSRRSLRYCSFQRCL